MHILLVTSVSNLECFALTSYPVFPEIDQKEE
jgi:hypothetical protein